MFSTPTKSATWPARLWPSALLAASATALAWAMSPQPMRWFVRAALLVGGLVAGLHELHRLRPARSHATPSALGLAGIWSWVWNAVALIFWSKILALILRYLDRDALHYFTDDAATYGTFWPRRLWLLAHIFGGMLALLLGPVQFWTGLRGTALPLHRWTGRAYGLGVLLAAGSAFHLGRFIAPAEGAMRSGVSMMILASVWLAATALAIRAILQRRVEAHRDWMTRSFVIAFAFVNIRWLIDAPFLAPLGTPAERVPLIIWASWVVPLFLTELALRWRGIPRNQRGDAAYTRT